MCSGTLVPRQMQCKKNAFLPWQTRGRRVEMKREINEGLIWGSAVLMAMQGWQWIDSSSPGIYQRYSEVFWGGGVEAERWRDERERALELEAQAQWWITYMLQQHRHAELTLRIDEPHLLSPFLPLPVKSSIPPSPSSILHLHLWISSLSVSLFFFISFLSSFFMSLSLSGPSHPSPLSLSLFCSPFFSLEPFHYPTHSVCWNQAREPWKCHTNKVRGSISVSQGDTFINDRSTRPCRCSITSAGACPWEAQHVWCVSECVRACLCVISSVGLAAARFTVELVGVDNSIREETDLEAEWRRRREMTAWSSSDQYCLVMTPWCVHQGHTKQTLPPFIALHHLYLCSVVCRLTGSLYGLHWGAGCYLLV